MTLLAILGWAVITGGLVYLSCSGFFMSFFSKGFTGRHSAIALLVGVAGLLGAIFMIYTAPFSLVLR